MRVSELVPRVKNKRFFLPFLTLGTSTKLLGFMRVLAILDPLEISSGGCTPGKPVRGRTGQAALSPSARAGGCTPGIPPICVPQRRKVSAKPMAWTCMNGSIKRERQLAAPRRDLTAEALRRCVAARAKPPSRLRQGRGVAPQTCRLLAFRKAGKVPAKLAARTRGIGSIKRERQLAAPGRDLTAEALRRGREVSSCTGVSVSSPPQGAKRQRRHSAKEGM